MSKNPSLIIRHRWVFSSWGASITPVPCQTIAQFLSESRALSRSNDGQNFFFRSLGRGCKWVYKGNISVRGVVRRTAVVAIAIVVIVVVVNSSFPRARARGANNKVSSGGSTTRRQIFKFPVTRKNRLLPARSLSLFSLTPSFSCRSFFFLLLFAYYPRRLDSRYNHWERRSSGGGRSPKTEGKINKVEEQSKLDGVMLLLPGEKWEKAGAKRGRKVSKGGLYYNGVSTPLYFLRHLSLLLLLPLLFPHLFTSRLSCYLVALQVLIYTW